MKNIGRSFLQGWRTSIPCSSVDAGPATQPSLGCIPAVPGVQALEDHGDQGVRHRIDIMVTVRPIPLHQRVHRPVHETSDQQGVSIAPQRALGPCSLDQRREPQVEPTASLQSVPLDLGVPRTRSSKVT